MLFNIAKTKVTYHITTADAKVHLNVDSSFTADDAYILQVIKDATQLAEDYIDGDIAKTTNIFEIYDFSGKWVKLFDVPFISLESVKYLDSDAVTQTVTLTDISIRKGGQKTILELPESLDTDLLTCNYTTGYEDDTTVPANIHRAILQKIADLYDVNRGSMMSKAFVDSGAFEMALNTHQKITY